MKRRLLTIGIGLIPFVGYSQIGIRPNIIAINCDDMGYGDLSCFGSPTTKTPNLDRMALEGQKWSSFYVWPQYYRQAVPDL